MRHAIPDLPLPSDQRLHAGDPRIDDGGALGADYGPVPLPAVAGSGPHGAAVGVGIGTSGIGTALHGSPPSVPGGAVTRPPWFGHILAGPQIPSRENRGNLSGNIPPLHRSNAPDQGDSNDLSALRMDSSPENYARFRPDHLTLCGSCLGSGQRAHGFGGDCRFCNGSGSVPVEAARAASDVS